MEKLKSAIPESLKHRINKSTPDDLHSTCSLLLQFFQDLPLFHQTVGDLTDSEMKLCAKNKKAALEAKASGNECFSKRDFTNALLFYSKALRVAPTDVEDTNKSFIATLYVNRASSLHNLGLFCGSLRDCNRALMINPAYAKAWFRRGKANASLKNYKEATDDLNVSLNMETSMSGRKQIQVELNTILDQHVEKNYGLLKLTEETSDELLKTKLQYVSTPAKGRGMASLCDIPQGSLVHTEDPYAAIILKHCRETHCHFCFNELSEDTVHCTSCSIPLYCSVECQVRAGGKQNYNYNKHAIFENLSEEIKDYIRHATSLGDFSLKNEVTGEHIHECFGVHWPVVLPPDVVLAGRVLVKYIKQQSSRGLDCDFYQIMDLCQNYEKLSCESKLEFHVYSIILLYCLRQTFASKLPLNPTVASQIIIIMSQIRVNSMGIANIRISDAKRPLYHNVTSSIEQVRVAQAVYCRGSMFNHSCQPNVHAYFRSRALFVRATENVAAGSELELSYGPQVGEWGCQKRREFLEDQYSFTCQCSGCLQINLSDIVISAYRCSEPNCDGVVLDCYAARYENEKLKHFEGQNSLQKGSSSLDCFKVASHVFYQTGPGKCFEPEHCSGCGTYCDLQASQKAIARSEFYIRRLQDAIVSSDIPTDLVMDALKSTFSLKKILHRFNKRIAEVEDNIAQAFCLVGDLHAALGHSQASIEILGKLYGENHIVIGHELIKLATIQQSVGLKGAAESMQRLVAIFSRYYGPHADTVLPSLPLC